MEAPFNEYQGEAENSKLKNFKFYSEEFESLQGIAWEEGIVHYSNPEIRDIFFGEVDDSGKFLRDQHVQVAMDKAEELKVIRLSMGKTRITREGFVQICERLKTSSHIRQFTSINARLFGDEKLGDWGAKMLVEAMKVNTKFTHIEMENCNLGNEGAKYVASLLSDPHTSIEVVDLQGTFDIGILTHVDNIIEDDGAITLANSLSNNKTVRVITLFSNYVDHSGAEAIAEMLKENKKLEQLIISGKNLLEPHEKGNTFTLYPGGDRLYAAIAFNDYLKDMEVDFNSTPPEYLHLPLSEIRKFSTAIEHG